MIEGAAAQGNLSYFTPTHSLSTNPQTDMETSTFQMESFLLSNTTGSDVTTTKNIYWGIVFPVLSAIAVVGNAVNIFVFSSNRLPASPFNTLLLGLAVTELSQGASFMLQKMVATYCGKNCNAQFLLVLEKLGDLSFYSANWVTVAMSVFRCIAVSHPFRSREILTRGRARVAVIASVLFSALKEIPYWIKDFLIDFDKSLRTIEPINQTFGRIVPCVIVLLTTLVSVLSVETSGRVTRRLTPSRSKNDVRVIRMLLVLLVIFLLSNVYCVVLLLLRIYGVAGVEPLLFSTPIAFGFNSAMNVFLYFVMNPRYREALCFCCRTTERRRRPAVDGSVTTVRTGSSGNDSRGSNLSTQHTQSSSDACCYGYSYAQSEPDFGNCRGISVVALSGDGGISQQPDPHLCSCPSLDKSAGSPQRDYCITRF